MCIYKPKQILLLNKQFHFSRSHAKKVVFTHAWYCICCLYLQKRIDRLLISAGFLQKKRSSFLWICIAHTAFLLCGEEQALCFVFCYSPEETCIKRTCVRFKMKCPKVGLFAPSAENWAYKSYFIMKKYVSSQAQTWRHVRILSLIHCMQYLMGPNLMHFAID